MLLGAKVALHQSSQSLRMKDKHIGCMVPVPADHLSRHLQCEMRHRNQQDLLAPVARPGAC